jgi:SAM-dependent methyltransferase
MSMSGSEAAGASGVFERLYAGGRKVNRYPYDLVVSFVLRRFGAGERARTRLLDYGCGGGNHARFLAAEGFDLHAVDNAPTAVELTRVAVAEAGGAVDPAKLRVADFAALPFPDDHFDAVIDRQSLGQNAASDLPRMVAEIARCLRPGGIYFGVNFSDRHPQLRFGRPRGGGDWGDFTEGVFRGLGQKHFFSVTEIGALFAPFELESVEALRHEPLLGPGGGSEELVVVARKLA